MGQASVVLWILGIVDRDVEILEREEGAITLDSGTLMESLAALNPQAASLGIPRAFSHDSTTWSLSPAGSSLAFCIELLRARSLGPSLGASELPRPSCPAGSDPLSLSSLDPYLIRFRRWDSSFFRRC